MPTRTDRVPADKTFFNLSGGLHTESSPLNFPDEVTLDESNMEILLDGSRRRRRGINYEIEGGSFNIDDKPYVAGDGINTYKWKDVNTVSTTNLIVVQLGTILHFYFDDNDTLAGNKHPEVVDLGAYMTDAEATSNSIITPVSMTHGRGKLFVTHKNITPIYITYTGTTSAFIITAIPFTVREFADIDDIYEATTQIATSPDITDGDAIADGASALTNLPNSHYYNLLNRGWLFKPLLDDNPSVADHDDKGAIFFAFEKDYWPTKAMIPYGGYKSVSPGTNTVVQDFGFFGLGHEKVWDSDKLVAEIFSNMDAPLGALVINPFDTTYPQTADFVPTYRDGHDDNSVIDHGSEIVDGKLRLCVKLQEVHGYDGSDLPATVTIKDFTFRVRRTNGLRSFYQTITGPTQFAVVSFPTTQRIKFDITLVRDGRDFDVSTYRKVTEGGQDGEFLIEFPAAAYTNTDAVVTTERPSANAWYAGRLFHAGVASERWADIVFFSRIVTQDKDYGHCLQAADPTHPEINALMPDDGGTIQLSNAGSILKLETMENALVAFTTNGIWEITGQGYFAADDIRVRKITNTGAISAIGVISIENGIVYTSTQGLYALSRDERTGQIISQSLSAGTIQTYWNKLSIPQQEHTFLTYDESKQRVWFLFNSSVTDTEYKYDTALILDLRIKAFFKYDFTAQDNCFIFAASSISEATQPDEYRKIKFFIVDGTEIKVADMSDTVFTDFCGDEQIPYLLGGYDNLGDFARRRYSPTIYTYMASTITGYERNAPIGDSSLTMQARWDFATDTDTGKYGRSQQVYRHTRHQIPSSSADTEHYDVVVARNKVRGTGRVLQLYFLGEAGKDAHILGYSIHYQGIGTI